MPNKFNDPPKLKLPVTDKSLSIEVFPVKLISPEFEAIIISPWKDVMSLPKNLKLPVVTAVPASTVDTSPVVTVKPLSAFAVNASRSTVVLPFSKSTKNESPILKFPKWSVEL